MFRFQGGQSGIQTSDLHSASREPNWAQRQEEFGAREPMQAGRVVAGRRSFDIISVQLICALVLSESRRYDFEGEEI